MDVPHTNRIWLQGRVISTPVIRPLNPRTKATAFTIAMTESWRDDAGAIKQRQNTVIVEVIGRDAESVAARARVGSIVTLEGYLRSDELKGQHVLRVRTLSITVWEDGDGQSRNDARPLGTETS
jgi:single-stranded DNA-binding protein